MGDDDIMLVCIARSRLSASALDNNGVGEVLALFKSYLTVATLC
jgi:hypothetical protein